jgi:hypothetical protein
MLCKSQLRLMLNRYSLQALCAICLRADGATTFLPKFS